MNPHKPHLQDIIVKSTVRQQRPPVEPLYEDTYRVAYEARPVRVRERHVPQGGVVDEDRFDRREGFRTDRRWLFIAIGVGCVILVSSVLLSFMFSGATVTVYPKQETVVVNATYLADAQGASGAVPFERMVADRTESEVIAAKEERDVEDRASGTITIYNEYAETPQRLIKNTRFQSSKERVYRIRESIEVPGKHKDGTPGSIDAVVVAEDAGEGYNTAGPESFSIPGFSGLPQEGKVYARSTAIITGGFLGKRRVVDEGERAAAIGRVEKKLQETLLADVFQSTDRPAGYHLFKEAIFYEFLPQPDVPEGEGKVTVSVVGKVHAVLFPDTAFAEKIASLTLPAYERSPITIENIQDLTVALTASSSTESAKVAPWDASSYTVHVEGKAHFIWTFDEGQFARDLAGKTKETLNNSSSGGMLELYPGIDHLEANVRPFWKRTFPEDPEKITIIKELDE